MEKIFEIIHLEITLDEINSLSDEINCIAYSLDEKVSDMKKLLDGIKNRGHVPFSH